MMKNIESFRKYLESMTGKKIIYTNSKDGFEDYKHFYIFKNSQEIMFAFETDAELEEFIGMNL